MSPESDDRESMRPEYDIRGGMRGKYLERYHDRQGSVVVFEDSVLIIASTASAPPFGHVTLSAPYLQPAPGAKIEVGTPEPVSFGR
jgi:hypothetical protein